MSWRSWAFGFELGKRATWARALDSFKRAVDLSWKVLVIVGFLGATNLIGSLPELTSETEAVRLIDVDQAGSDASIRAAVDRYNERVEAREGTRLERGDNS